MADKKVFKAGGILAGKKFTIDDTFLNYKGVYGEYLQIPLKDIDTVSIDSAGAGMSYIKIIGRGSELGKVKMPAPWAIKSQQWILENIK